MATINFIKEWQRIADRLGWTVIKLNQQLAVSESDEERRGINAKLEQVRSQINQALSEVARLKAISSSRKL